MEAVSKSTSLSSVARSRWGTGEDLLCPDRLPAERQQKGTWPGTRQYQEKPP